MKTLYELVLQPLEHQINKHGLDTTAQDQLDQMSPAELVQTISDALEQYMAQFKQSN